MMATNSAFLDTCCLFGAYLCDTMLRLAEAGTYRPLWSADVLDELERNLIERGLAKERVMHRVGEMRRSFPDAEVFGYETLVHMMSCDPKDRHVLAAAVRGDAQLLITFNIRDFPEGSVSPFDVSVISPDGFLLDQLDLYPGHTLAALRAQASSYVSPAMTLEDLLGRLATAGVSRFASEASRHLAGPSSDSSPFA